MANESDPKLTITFFEHFVAVEGDAPRAIAPDLCEELARVVHRHGLGLHISVSALASDEDIVANAAIALAEARKSGVSSFDFAVMAASLPLPEEITMTCGFSNKAREVKPVVTIGQELRRRATAARVASKVAAANGGL